MDTASEVVWRRRRRRDAVVLTHIAIEQQRTLEIDVMFAVISNYIFISAALTRNGFLCVRRHGGGDCVVNNTTWAGTR